MALFEVETDGHIVVVWADTKDGAKAFCRATYPAEDVIRVSQRPLDAWVISKRLLGLRGPGDPAQLARRCLLRAYGDKDQAVALYAAEAGCSEDDARKAIESNLAVGW